MLYSHHVSTGQTNSVCSPGTSYIGKVDLAKEGSDVKMKVSK